MTARRSTAILLVAFAGAGLVAAATFFRAATTTSSPDSLAAARAAAPLVSDTPGLSPDTVTRHPDFDVLAAPSFATIRVDPDTVWFLGEIYPYLDPPVSYAYARATGAWLRRDARPDLDRGHEPLRPHARDTVTVAPGVRLVTARGGHSGSHALLLEDGSVYELPQEVPLDTKRRLVSALYQEWNQPEDTAVAAFPLENTVSAWVVRDSTLWLGRAGEWSEMTGGLGGLVRFDPATRRTEALWSEDLAAATVTGLAFAGGRLWIGTLRPGEYGPWGDAGVLLYDPATGGWDRLDDETSPLPGNLVWALAGAGDTVWIAADEGLARVDAAAGEWDVRYFEPVLAGDTIVHVLRAGRPAPDPVRDVAFRLMTMLGVERRAAFLEAARSAPARAFTEPYRTNAGWSRALAYRGFIPFLEAAMRRNAAPAVVIAAFGFIPASEWDPAPLREIMESRPVTEAAVAALALARAGHADGLAWLRRTLADPSVEAGKTEVMQALGALPDTASIPPIAAGLEESGLRFAAYRALRSMGTDTAWLAIAHAGRDNAAVRSSILADVEEEEYGAPLHLPRFEALVREVAHIMLADGDLIGAAYLLRRGDLAAVPVVLEEMRSGRRYNTAAAVFVRATGVHEAPYVDRFGEEPGARERSLEFWTRWWDENAASFRPVGPDSGLAALREWHERGES